jgi:hypothetical protein
MDIDGLRKQSVLFNKRMLGEYVYSRELSKHGKEDDDVESIIIQYVYVDKIEDTIN